MLGSGFELGQYHLRSFRAVVKRLADGIEIPHEAQSRFQGIRIERPYEPVRLLILRGPDEDPMPIPGETMLGTARPTECPRPFIEQAPQCAGEPAG